VLTPSRRNLREGASSSFMALIARFVFSKKIQDKLQSRQFELVEILERAEESTGKGGKENKVNGGEGRGACTITWTDVVRRMVTHRTFEEK